MYAATSARSDRRARFSSLQRKRVRIRGAVRLRDQRVGVWGVLGGGGGAGLGGNRLRICRGTLQTAWPKPSESLRPPAVLQRLLRHLSPAKRDAPPPSPKRRPETAGRQEEGGGAAFLYAAPRSLAPSPSSMNNIYPSLHCSNYNREPITSRKVQHKLFLSFFVLKRNSGERERVRTGPPPPAPLNAR